MHGTLGVIDIFVQSPSVTIKSFLTTLHLLGLVFGLGAATMLDLIILRFLVKNRVAGEHWNIIELLSKSVTVGLVMLWVSGLGFLFHYAMFDPGKLANPKIWAKISIVAILTTNGFFIHRIVLPQIRARIGRHLFQGMSTSRMRLLLVLGTISGTSWYVPLFLGAIPLFNFALSVPAFLLLYALLVLAAIFTALVIGRLVLPEPPTVTIPRGEYLALRRAARRGTERLAGVNHKVASIAGELLAFRNKVGVPLRSTYQFAAGAAVMVGSTIVAGAVFQGSPGPLNSGQSSGTTREVPRTSLASFSSNIGHDEGAGRRPTSAAMFRHGNIDEAWSALVPISQPEPAAAARWRRHASSAAHTLVSAQAPSGADAPVALSNRRANAEPTKRSPVSGVWAPDSLACSLQHNRDGLLRTTISAEGAHAGETTCIFKRKVEIQKGWKIVAACSSGNERWTANAKLVVDRNTLTWSSERGTQTYVRCSAA